MKVKFKCAVIVDGKRYSRGQEIDVSAQEAKALQKRIGDRVEVFQEAEVVESNDDAPKSPLDGLLKAQLQELCEKAELDTDGTVADLKARLEAEVDDLQSLIEE